MPPTDPAPLSAGELEEIERLLEKMTPGPWTNPAPETLKVEYRSGTFGDEFIYAPGNAFPWRMAELQGPDDRTAKATAAGIVALVNAAPRLLAELRAKQQEIAEWKRIHEQRGLALERPCIACGHKPVIVRASGDGR